MTQLGLLEWTPPVPYPGKGETFDSERDGKRLGDQCRKVFDAMKDGQWRTLAELSELTGAPEASASARLRDLRRYGFKVEREYVERGLWRYRVVA